MRPLPRSACLPLVLAALAAAILRAAGTDVTGVVRVGGRPQGGAAIWLEAPSAPKPAPRTAVLEQRNLDFSPRVLVIPAGTTVEFPNNDRVFHNAFSFRDGRRFDLGLYPVGTVRRVEFPKAGLSRIFCNIHPNMAAYILAVDSAYYGVSDDEGRFTIRDVPPAAYKWHAWRAGKATLTNNIDTREQSRLEIAWP